MKLMHIRLKNVKAYKYIDIAKKFFVIVLNKGRDMSYDKEK